MESLLRWSIENSTPAGPDSAPAPRKDLDPGIIDLILGKPDAELMKEALAIAVDNARTEDERVGALDELEMLIEQIDNANNLEKLQMWRPLQDLLTAPTSTAPIKTQTLWVIGTALQNNPAAQNAYLTLAPLPTLTSFLHPSPDPDDAEARSKAVYALSGLLKHNATAVAALDAQGWAGFNAALEDSNIAVRRKTAFLLNTLLIPTPLTAPPTTRDPVHANSHASMLSDPISAATAPLAAAAVSAHGLARTVVSALVRPVPWGVDGDGDVDADFEEKALRMLHTYVVECKGELAEDEKKDFRAWLDARRSKGEHDTEEWGLSESEIGALRESLQ